MCYAVKAGRHAFIPLNFLLLWFLKYVLCLLRGVSVVFLWCEVVVVPCVFMGGPGFSL